MSFGFRRYQQSPRNQSAFLNSSRNSASKQKISSQNNSSLIKNPEIQIRLPSLSRSSMRKSFSTFQSDRNTKFKLQALEQKLQQIKHNIHNIRQQTKQTIQFNSYIRQSLVDKQLLNINKDLKQKIIGLQNLIKNTVIDNRSRANDIRDSCNLLWNSNEELKQLTFHLRMKVQQVQGSLGFKA